MQITLITMSKTITCILPKYLDCLVHYKDWYVSQQPKKCWLAVEIIVILVLQKVFSILWWKKYIFMSMKRSKLPLRSNERFHMLSLGEQQIKIRGWYIKTVNLCWYKLMKNVGLILFSSIKFRKIYVWDHGLQIDKHLTKSTIGLLYILKSLL